MKKRVVITGVGLIHPLGHSLEALVAQLGHSPSEQTGGSVHMLADNRIVWKLNDLDVRMWVNGRLERKIDEYCRFGISAAMQALRSAQLDIHSLPPQAIGMCIGNTLGGWGYIENEVVALHNQGVSAMSPYVATAWFPAALQGQLSLLTGIRGYSKTFSTMQVAGLQALGYAAEAIRNGRTKVMLCGASEALSSSYVQSLLPGSSKEKSRKGNSRPSEQPRIFSEGATFFVLEDAVGAETRGARIFGEVLAFEDRFICNQNSELDPALSRFHSSMNALLGNQFSVTGVTSIAVIAGILGETTEPTSERNVAVIEQLRRFQSLTVQETNSAGNRTALVLAAPKAARRLQSFAAHC